MQCVMDSVALALFRFFSRTRQKSRCGGARTGCGTAPAPAPARVQLCILGNFLCHTVAVTMTHLLCVSRSGCHLMTHLLCVSHSGCHLMTHLLLMSHSGCHLMTNLLLMLLQLMLKCCNVNQAGSNDLHMGWAHCQGLEASHLIFCCRTGAGILVSTRCLQSIDLP